jgi:hypothetical protein
MYYLFAYDQYYPRGEVSNLAGRFTTIDEAKDSFYLHRDNDYGEITNSNLQVIARLDRENDE